MGQAYQSRKYPSNRRPYNRRRRRRRRRRRGFFGIPIPTLLLAAVLLIAVVAVCFMTMGKSEKIQNGEGGIKTMLAGQKTEIDTTTPAEPRKLIIMIDSGHGGNDPGCIKENAGGDIYEKDINLAIAQKLKRILEENGYEVIMTRDKDIFLSLEERVSLSKEKNPDIFVSIHQNILKNDTTSNGIETHYYELPDLDSRMLAETVQRFLVENTAARDRGTCNDSDLYVLKNNTVPACLIETGFLSAAEEGKQLLESGYQDKIAEGIAKGIQNYMEKRIK